MLDQRAGGAEPAWVAGLGQRPQRCGEQLDLGAPARGGGYRGRRAGHIREEHRPIMPTRSDNNRRPNVRWWQLATLALLALLVVLSPEWVALGTHGAQFQTMIAAEAGLVVLALLCSILPRAMRWTSRRVDVVRRGGAEAPPRADL